MVHRISSSTSRVRSTIYTGFKKGDRQVLKFKFILITRRLGSETLSPDVPRLPHLADRSAGIKRGLAVSGYNRLLKISAAEKLHPEYFAEIDTVLHQHASCNLHNGCPCQS